MSVYTATSQPTNDLNWYSDSGSTHHLTNDLQNLNLPAEPYTGPDNIQVGHSAGLPIHHVGSSKLSTSSNTFSLQHLLHIPTLKKNLILVGQFTSNYKVFN